MSSLGIVLRLSLHLSNELETFPRNHHSFGDLYKSNLILCKLNLLQLRFINSIIGEIHLLLICSFIVCAKVYACITGLYRVLRFVTSEITPFSQLKEVTNSGKEVNIPDESTEREEEIYVLPPNDRRN